MYVSMAITYSITILFEFFIDESISCCPFTFVFGRKFLRCCHLFFSRSQKVLKLKKPSVTTYMNKKHFKPGQLS